MYLKTLDSNTKFLFRPKIFMLHYSRPRVFSVCILVQIPIYFIQKVVFQPFIGCILNYYGKMGVFLAVYLLQKYMTLIGQRPIKSINIIYIVV